MQVQGTDSYMYINATITLTKPVVTFLIHFNLAFAELILLKQLFFKSPMAFWGLVMQTDLFWWCWPWPLSWPLPWPLPSTPLAITLTRQAEMLGGCKGVGFGVVLSFLSEWSISVAAKGPLPFLLKMACHKVLFWGLYCLYSAPVSAHFEPFWRHHCDGNDIQLSIYLSPKMFLWCGFCRGAQTPLKGGCLTIFTSLMKIKQRPCFCPWQLCI